MDYFGGDTRMGTGHGLVHLTDEDYADEGIKARWRAEGLGTMRAQPGHPVSQVCQLCSTGIYRDTVRPPAVTGTDSAVAAAMRSLSTGQPDASVPDEDEVPDMYRQATGSGPGDPGE